MQRDGLTNATSSVWQGSVSAATFVFTGEGAYVGPQLPVPPLLATIYTQGLVIDLTTLQAANTNRVATKLLP